MSEWIDARKLPNDDREVLCWAGTWVVASCQTMLNGERFWLHPLRQGITHWMELTTPSADLDAVVAEERIREATGDVGVETEEGRIYSKIEATYKIPVARLAAEDLIWEVLAVLEAEGKLPTREATRPDEWFEEWWKSHAGPKTPLARNWARAAWIASREERKG